jgi:hypothetical protein
LFARRRREPTLWCPVMKEAFRGMAALGEVCGVLRKAWGVHKPSRRSSSS